MERKFVLGIKAQVIPMDIGLIKKLYQAKKIKFVTK